MRKGGREGEGGIRGRKNKEQLLWEREGDEFIAVGGV